MRPKTEETLIIVTADHETGGLALVGGDMKTGMVKGAFSTGDHTGVMVPVFAYGPGAENFTGIMENTGRCKKDHEINGFLTQNHSLFKKKLWATALGSSIVFLLLRSLTFLNMRLL